MLHPALIETSTPIAAGELIAPRAMAMAQYLGAEDHPDARLLECRRVASHGLEYVVFEVRVERPQDAVVDLERWEPIAMAFSEDDRYAPTVLAARADFPDTPHQNPMPMGFIRSPCVDDRPWPDAKASWTPLSFIERIRWWLGAAARGALSDEGQALDPLFVAAGPDVAVPRAFLQADAAPGAMTLFRAPPGDDPKLFLLHPEGAGLGGGNGAMLLVPVRLPPQRMGAMRWIPQTLQDLVAELSTCGGDLIAALRHASEAVLVPPHHNPPRVTVLVTAPMTRETGGAILAQDAKAFVINLSLGELGVRLGALWANPEFQPGARKAAPYGKPIAWSPPAGLDTITVLPLRVHVAFDRVLAAQCSGRSTLDERKVLMIGAGAIGSHVSLALAREGLFRWTIVDDDHLLPHNLARHTLGPRGLGAMKAEAVAAEITALLGPGSATALIVNLDHPGEKEPALLAAAAASDLIIDASASVAVARSLSHADSNPRCVSVFFNPAGTAAVLLAEDGARSIRLSAIEAQYYRRIIRSADLHGHLAPPAGRVRYSGACRQLTNAIPSSNVMLLSGLAARGLGDVLAGSESHCGIWSMAHDGSVAALRLTPAKVRDVAIGEWRITYDEDLVADMAQARADALPAETGGVLVGIVDTERKSIFVVDALPAPPDSVGSPGEFVRGVSGLPEQLRQISNMTQDQVRYIGEWHTHPRGHSAAPSGVDLAQLAYLHSQLDREGIPPVVMITGETGEALISILPFRKEAA